MEIRPLRAVNILLLSARGDQVAIPLFWALPDNPSGNSSVSDRINLLEEALTLVGPQRMGLLVADRELVGADGVGYVVKRGIDVGRRLPCTHPIGLGDGQVRRVEAQLVAKPERFYEQVLVEGPWLNGNLKRLGGSELLYFMALPNSWISFGSI